MHKREELILISKKHYGRRTRPAKNERSSRNTEVLKSEKEEVTRWTEQSVKKREKTKCSNEAPVSRKWRARTGRQTKEM
jgi:hypothetical protein